MATYFWVGGAGTWNSTDATNWSLSSNGSGGAGVPTSTDNVVIDTNSGIGTISCTGGTANCLDYTVTATQAISTLFPINCYGSVSMIGTGSFAANSLLYLLSTTTGKTIDTNNRQFAGGLQFNGVGGGWTFLSAFQTVGQVNFSVNAGTVDTNGFTLNIYSIDSTGSTTRALNLGASSITVSSTLTPPISFSGTGLTFNAGTSTITQSSTSTATFAGGGYTFYNVIFSGSTISLTGANTFNNLTITAPADTKTLNLSGNQTVNGTLTTTVGAVPGQYRTAIKSSNVAITYTITAAAVSLVDTDFYHITAAGTASPFTGTRLSNLGGNTNITFPAAKTVYLVGTTSVSMYSTAWATSSNGATAGTNFPLGQDTAVIDDNSANAGVTITGPSPNVLGSLSFSTRTTTVITSSLFIYGSFTGSSALTISGSYIWFYGSGTINQNSATINANGIYIQTTGTYQLTSNATLGGISSVFFSLVSGTLDLNDFTLTCPTFFSNNTNTRTLAFGTSGKIVVTSNNATLLNLTGTNLTTTGSKNVEANYTGSSGTRTFTQTGLTETQSLNVKVTAGADLVLISYANDVTFTGFTGSWSISGAYYVYGSVTLCAGMTTLGSSNLNLIASSGSKTITTNGVTFVNILNFGVTGGTATYTLQDNLATQNYIVNFYSGTLDLNNKTLTCERFYSANTETRTLAFGTSGKIIATGQSTTILYILGSNFTTTGNKLLEAPGPAIYNSRTINQTNVTEAQVLNVNVTGGSDTIYFNYVNNIDFTGFTGTLSFANLSYVYGNLTLSTGMTLSGINPLAFAATSGSKTVTTNGKTFPFPVYFGNLTSTATWTLQDSFTSTTTLEFSTGTLNTNSKTVTCSSFSMSSSYSKTLTTGSSIFNITGNGWTVSTVVGNATVNAGTSTINMLSGSTKTFTGAGKTYYNLVQAGLGTLTISGNNTFNNLSNTVQPTQITFTSSSTQTFSNFSLSGTAANLVTLAPSISGTSYTLSAPSGVIVNSDYLSISRSTATGGAAWYAGGNSINGGNNSGWIFTSAPVVAFVTSVTGTTAVGTSTFSLGVQVSVNNITGYVNIGTVSVSLGSTTSVTGLFATGSVGTVSVVFGITVSATGVVGTGAVGTASITGNGLTTTTGVVGTTALGNVSVTGDSNVSVTKVTGTTQLGNISIDSFFPVTGVQGTTAVGTVSFVTNNFIPVTKVTGTGAIGTVSVSQGIGVSVTSVTGSGIIGNVTLSLAYTVYVTGFYNPTTLGNVTVLSNNFIPVTGVEGIGSIGITTVTSPIADVTGVQGTGRVGSVTVTAQAIVSVTGVYGTALLNTGQQTTVTGVSGTILLNYVSAITWSAVNTYEASDWNDLPYQSGKG
jgi:hypothetical protein